MTLTETCNLNDTLKITSDSQTQTIFTMVGASVLNVVGELICEHDSIFEIKYDSNFTSTMDIILKDQSQFNLFDDVVFKTNNVIQYNESIFTILAHHHIRRFDMNTIYLYNNSTFKIKISSPFFDTRLKLRIYDNAIFEMEEGNELLTLEDIELNNNGSLIPDSINYMVFLNSFQNSSLFIKPNATINSIHELHFNQNGFFQMGVLSNIKYLYELELRDNSVFNILNNSTIEKAYRFYFNENAFFTMYGYSSVLNSENLIFTGYSKIIFLENSLVNTTRNFELNGNSNCQMFFESKFNYVFTMYIRDFSTFIMNSSEITQVQNYIIISGSALFEMNNDSIIRNVRQIKINRKNSKFEMKNSSFLNSSSIEITNGTFVLNINGDRNGVNSTNLLCKNNGTFEVSYTSFITIQDTLMLDSCNIITADRTIRDLPIFFTNQINSIDFTFQSLSEVDLAFSVNPIQTTLPQNTKLLMGNRLLRLGTSNKVFCHLINMKSDYSEPYCPCDSVNCYITPLENITSILLNIDTSINTHQKYDEVEEELDIESVAIENKKISFYKTDNFILGVISHTENLVTDIKSLTKTVLMVSNQSFVFQNVVSKSIYSSENGTKFIINPMCKNGGHFNTTTQQCDNCLDSNCIDCSYNSKECLRCQQEYYITNDSKCVEIPNCLLKRSNRCLKCSDGYLLTENHCQNVSSCLIQTSNGTCQICSLKTFNFNNSSCEIADEHLLYTNQNNIIACKSGYITNSNNCQKCSDLYKSSEVCENGRPTKCEIEFEMNKSGQCEHNNCSDPNDENGRCSKFYDKCTFITNSKCLECYNNLILNNAECRTNYDLQCTNQSLVSCLRCKDAYYFNSSTNRCERCDSNCLTCVMNMTYCLSCPPGFYISNNICKTNSELVGICTQFISSGGCAKCAEGYYRNGLDCYKCDLSCSLCNTNFTCLTCNSTNYKTWSGDCKSQSSLIGCDVNVTQYGCTRCKEGYFQVNTNECEKCDTTCLTCSFKRSCESCLSSKVLLSSGICVTLSQITKCKEIINSKCNKCSFWNAPSLDGTYCEKRAVWWVILVVVLFIIFVLSILVIVLIFSTKRILKMIHTKEQEKTTTIFGMEKSNVKFNSLANNICVSSKELNFNSEIEEIPVNTETKIVFCVGNMSKNVLKIQFTTTTQIDKFTIRVTPEVVMLKKKFACEFSIYLKPECTCRINNTICIVSKNLKTNVENINEIIMKGITSQSTRIDYEELIEESKLGEGSF
ncbi:cysteine surface protein, putative, partial [Entamoeba invadens IP1]